jgi:peroxiredoxin Q/BCP
VAYFTASCDEPDVNKKFAESMELDYPILSDPTTKTAQAYGLVKEGGRNASRRTFYIGKDGRILHVDAAVKAGAHGAYIAAKLEELGVAKRP